MTFPLIDIPVIFGLSIEVYFILFALGIPTFFFWRWLFKKYIKADTTRKILTWVATIFLTPCIYIGLVLLWIFSISYYPNRNFDQQKWLNEKDKRYELSNNLIKTKMLLGKSKTEVRLLLGDESDNKDSLNVWYYDLGIRPELFNIDDSYLKIEFHNDKVLDVEQQK